MEGNHLGSDTDPDKPSPAVLRYSGGAGHPLGYSLGDWGPYAVPGVRAAAPVITVEVHCYYESGALKDLRSGVVPDCNRLGAQVAKRCKELQAHADALINKFLERIPGTF